MKITHGKTVGITSEITHEITIEIIHEKSIVHDKTWKNISNNT